MTTKTKDIPKEGIETKDMPQETTKTKDIPKEGRYRCVIFCQISEGGEIRSVDEGEEVVITADTVWPEKCFRKI